MSWPWRFNSSSSPKHGGQRRRLGAAGFVRVTKKGRRLNDQERRAVVDQMIRDGKLPRVTANERI
jgi:hypothetical protein